MPKLLVLVNKNNSCFNVAGMTIEMVTMVAGILGIRMDVVGTAEEMEKSKVAERSERSGKK